MLEGIGAVLQTAPASEPLSTAEAKTHLRVDHSTEDSYIDALVTAAREWWERTYGRALIDQTWDESFRGFPDSTQSGFLLSRAPAASVTSITYYDEDLSTSTVVTSTDYQLDTTREPAVVVLKSGQTWPTDSLRGSSGVVIRYVAGYGTNASDVPEPIRHALRLIVGQLYAHREPEVTGTIVSPVKFAVRALSEPYRLWWF